MNLGDKILDLRKKNNLSQEQLAEKMNVARQTISKWELKETAPDIKQANELSKIFNVTLDELVGNDKKDILVEKVSNTEKLAGIIIKILKFGGIAFVILLIIEVIAFIAFSFFVIKDSDEGSELTTKISCTLHDENYLYEVNYYEESGRIIASGGDGYLGNITDAEKYNDAHKLIDKIDSYVKNNGGSCTIEDFNNK